MRPTLSSMKQPAQQAIPPPVRWHDLGNTDYVLPCPGRRCQICKATKGRRVGRRQKAS